MHVLLNFFRLHCFIPRTRIFVRFPTSVSLVIVPYRNSPIEL